MIKVVGILLLAGTVVVGVVSRYVFKKTDNVVEETAEEIIKKKTGIDIDLSPDTPEKEENGD